MKIEMLKLIRISIYELQHKALEIAAGIFELGDISHYFSIKDLLMRSKIKLIISS